MTDSVDIVQQKRLEITQALKKDYEELFSTPTGKRVLKDIMLSGVMERSAFSTDTILMAANCAKQDFVRHIAQMAEPAQEDKRAKKAKK